MAVCSVTDGATAARRPAGSRDQGDIDMSNDTYKREYTREFVSRWDRLIGWNSRAEGENGFFERLLRRHDCREVADIAAGTGFHAISRSEEHTSELQSLMRISYAVLCLTQKQPTPNHNATPQ